MNQSAPPELFRPNRRWTVSLYNCVGRGVRRLGYSPSLDVDSILDAAQRKTGLSDFGDERFREPLQVLVDDFEASARLNPLGRSSVRKLLIATAANRLLLNRCWQEHPDYLEVPPARPLIVVGLPRTGTTLLYNLLCQDPASRPLMFWEAQYPAPLPLERRTGSNRIRRWHVWTMVAALNYAAPHFRRIHQLKADGPEECGWLLNSTFISQMFLMHGRIPNYIDYFWSLPRERMLDAYAHYRRSLQWLQAGRDDRHWILKSPVHRGTLDVLLDTIPDAQVVCTHRDPRQVIPSLCSLIGTSHGILSDSVSPTDLGREVLKQLTRTAERARNVTELHSRQIFDVSYQQLVSDPIGAVSSIYARFGREMTSGFSAGMQRWLQEHPQNKFGRHHYSLEQFGLTAGDVEDCFGLDLKYVAVLEAGTPSVC